MENAAVSLISAKKAGEALGISEAEVYRLKLPRYFPLPNTLRYDEADIAAYKANPPPPPSARLCREIVRMHRLADATYALPEYVETLAAKRHRRMRMPPWANPKAIRAVYAEAKRLTDATGIPHHVDHIIPLQGELVSGLHVETNLRAIPAVDNLRKHNKVQP